VGGFLSSPVEHYPHHFTKGGLFSYYPYLLPNIVCATVSAIGVICGVFFLEETIDATASPESEDSNISTKIPNLLDKLVSATRTKLQCFSYDVILAILIYSLHLLFQVMNDELYPLWCASHIQEGGIELTQQDIGMTLSFAGMSALFHQVVSFSLLYQKLGLRRTFSLSIFLYIMVFVTQPNLTYLRKSAITSFWVLLFTSLFLRTLAMTSAYTCSMIMVKCCCVEKSTEIAIGIK
jgi:hypothetical protein